MWECDACGCRGIAAGLTVCPMCGKEYDMPKATSGGASNAWEQPDGEVFEMDATWEPAEAPAADAVPEQPAAEETGNTMVVGEPGPEITDLPDGAPVVAEPRATKARKA